MESALLPEETGHSSCPGAANTGLPRPFSQLLRVYQPLTFRPLQPGDETFLYEVYASTREQEMALWASSPEEKAAFLRMQFEAQHAFYQKQFPNGDFFLVLSDGRPVGRLYLEDQGNEVLLIEVALLPKSRRLGLGRRLFEALFEVGTSRDCFMVGHVEWWNPAIYFFLRIGFQITGKSDTHYQIRWVPERLSPPA
ncbi:MAG TPA: GNAT family N-acetyltransferase [Chthoniobacterales bacterium]